MQEREEAEQQQNELASGVQVSPVTEGLRDVRTEWSRRTQRWWRVQTQHYKKPVIEEENDEKFLMGREFADDIFVAGWEGQKLSRSQKRAARQPFSTRPESKEPVSHILDVFAQEVRQMQEADEMHKWGIQHGHRRRLL